jgi:glycolate oxidase FAD binding subunit
MRLAELIGMAERVLTDGLGPWGIATPERKVIANIAMSRLAPDDKEFQEELSTQPIRFEHVKLLHNRGITSFSPENQVVTVKSGTRLWDLQRELQKLGFALPLWFFPFADEEETGDEDDSSESLRKIQSFVNFAAFDTVGGAISLDLPHPLMGKTATWRDWLIGARIVLASGEVIKSGSGVVKSVSGFDIHKLMVGARSTLGVFSEVALRVVPLASVPEPEILRQAPANELPATWDAVISVYRVPLSKLSRFLHEWQAQTIFAEASSGFVVLHGDGCPREHLAFRANDAQVKFGDISPQTQALMRRTKQLFDPTNKLNPGEFGFI